MANEGPKIFDLMIALKIAAGDEGWKRSNDSVRPTKEATPRLLDGRWAPPRTLAFDGLI